MSKLFGVQSIPFVLIFNGQGKLEGRVLGFGKDGIEKIKTFIQHAIRNSD
jgi:hypothetical protein